MLFDKSVEAFDTYLKANRGLSENTRNAYRGDVEECLLALERLRCRDLNEVTIEDLRMWRNHRKTMRKAAWPEKLWRYVVFSRGRMSMA